MNSRSTSPVGAITAPACASRNRRSMLICFENAAPPQMRMAVEVTPMATSPAAALLSSTRNMVASRGLSRCSIKSSIRAESPSVSICMEASCALSLGESLPTLRAQLASMQIDTDGLSARIDDLIEHLESPREATMLRVLESKAAAGDVAIGVTSTAMRICGGAAFSKHMSIERLFRDAHAGAVMAPTGDVLREFIGKALLGMPLF